MTRFLNRLAPFALVLIAAVGAPACAAPTDAAGSVDPASAAGNAQLKPRARFASDLAQDAEALAAMSSELRSVVSQVDATVRSLQLRGSADVAVNVSLARYDEAAARQLRQLDDINMVIQSYLGAHYPSADADAEGNLGSQMGFLTTWDFSSLSAAVSELQASAARTDSLLHEGRTALSRLGEVWGGSGTEAFAQVQTRWDASSSEVNVALRNLVTTVSQAVEQMQQTDQAVTGMFQG